MRNCGDNYPDSRFKFQLQNREILTQCPLTFFTELETHFLNKYNQLKTLKELGVASNANDILVVELEAYSIIEEELYSYQLEQSNKQEKELNSQLRKSGHGRNP